MNINPAFAATPANGTSNFSTVYKVNCQVKDDGTTHAEFKINPEVDRDVFPLHQIVNHAFEFYFNESGYLA